MHISEVMKILEMSKKSIEIYEKSGLISPMKDESGYRIYGEKELNILKKVQMLRKMDFSISEIKLFITEQDDQLFYRKKEQLEREAFQIATKLQYLDYVRLAMENDDQFMEVNEDLRNSLKVFDDEGINEEIRRLNHINFNMINTILWIIAFVFFASTVFIPMKYVDIFILIAYIFIAISLLINKVIKVQSLIAKILYKLGIVKDS